MSGMSAFRELAIAFSINPITGDSEADRVVVSESLYENPGSDPSLALEDIGS